MESTTAGVHFYICCLCIRIFFTLVLTKVMANASHLRILSCPLPHILFHSYMQPYSSWSSLLLISFSIFSHFFNYLPYFPCPCPFSFLSLSVSSFVCTGPQSEICSMEQGLFHGSSHFQTSASPRHKAAGSALYSHRNVRYYRIEGTYCVICVIWS